MLKGNLVIQCCKVYYCSSLSVNFNFMFRLHANDPDSEMGRRALEMTCHTLKMMGKGGIHDHVAQVHINTHQDFYLPSSFVRYSNPPSQVWLTQTKKFCQAW